MVDTAKWHADVVNDPSRDYDLCIEIYESDVHRATLRREGSGEVTATWYASAVDVIVPASWFAALLERAEAELPFPGVN